MNDELPKDPVDGEVPRRRDTPILGSLASELMKHGR